LALAETAQLAVRINLEGNASAGIDKLTRKVNGLGGATKRIGKGFGQIGSGLARSGLLIGGAAVTGLGAAAKAAIDFEDAFAGVKKTVDEADLQAAGLSFDKLERSFRDMATTIPIAATEFARLGETAGALGVEADAIESFVETTAKLGVTTDLTADAAADAFGRIGTILNFTAKDYVALADSIVALGNAGASVESEITEIIKRFAGEAKAAGLAHHEIAGLASVTASLGFAPERGGTALSRVFGNLATNISLANDKGQVLSEGLGRTIKDLRKSVNKGDGLGIFLDVLETIRDMKPTEANRFLAGIGVKNVSDRTLFRSMAAQLPEVTKQLGIAATAAGALEEEASKRFDTIASKLMVLKNNAIEAGITIGEGMLPAIGRAAAKLTKFMQDPANKNELKKLGEDIGQAIDDIDWADVLRDAKSFVGVLKSAFAVTMTLVSAFNKLPTEIKAAVAGIITLNKLSGGLLGAGIGNVVGGIGETIARAGGSRLPGVGKLFAQPVFVTNWPIGGLGGVPGAGGKGGMGVGAAVGALGVAGLIVAAAVPIGEAFASALPKELKGADGTGKSESQTRIENALAEMAEKLPKTPSRPTEILDPRDAHRSGRDAATIEKGLASVKSEERTSREALKAAITASAAETRRESERGFGIVARIAGETKRETSRGLGLVESVTERVRSAAIETKRETGRGSGIVRNQTRSSGAGIEAAIRANRPVVTTIVNVNATTVSKTYNVSKRYGPKNGSRNANSNGSGTLGNGGE
jgi:TP901 family phage tail tape measure protein